MTGKTAAVYGRFLTVMLICLIVLNPVGGVGAVGSNAATIESVTIQTAPRSSFDHLDTSNVSEFATNDTGIATGDVLIFRLATSGQSDALDGDLTEQRFLELVRSDVIDLRINQIRTTRAAKTFNLSATIENGGLEVFNEGNTVYIAMDTERAVFDQGETTVGFESGERFRVTFTHSGDGTGAVMSEFRIVPRTATFETQATGKVIVEAAENQTVAGETSVAPGTDLTIRTQSEGQSSFVITQTVQVGENGDFETDFDFTNVTRGISFELTIPNQGFENNASITGVVRLPPAASIRVNSQERKGEHVRTVTIRSVTLSDGGFLAVYDSAFLNGDNVTTPMESLRGTSGYLTAGKHTMIDITLDNPYINDGAIIVVPHQDTNDNEKYDFVTNNGSVDSPYLGADGDPLVASANVTVNQHRTENTTERGTRTGTDGTSTPQATSVAVAATATGANETRTMNEDSNVSDSGTDNDTVVSQQPDTNSPDMTTEVLGPGFGFIVGFVALCVAALLAIRRND